MHPSLAESWLIATAEAGSFTSGVLDLLSLDLTQFTSINSLDGGTFALQSANGESELILAFTPSAIGPVGPVIPEPSSLLLLSLGMLGLHRTCRRVS